MRPRLASNTAGSGLGPWYLARAKALSVGLSNACFNRSDFRADRRVLAQPTRTAVYGPVRTVVWQGSAGDRRPYADLVAKGLVIAEDRHAGHFDVKRVTAEVAYCRRLCTRRVPQTGFLTVSRFLPFRRISKLHRISKDTGFEPLCVRHSSGIGLPVYHVCSICCCW